MISPVTTPIDHYLKFRTHETKPRSYHSLGLRHSTGFVGTAVPRTCLPSRISGMPESSKQNSPRPQQRRTKWFHDWAQLSSTPPVPSIPGSAFLKVQLCLPARQVKLLAADTILILRCTIWYYGVRYSPMLYYVILYGILVYNITL